MKIKRLLLVVSVVSFLTISFAACSEDGIMDQGGSAGNPPPTYKITKQNTDSISTTKHR